jgi:hypothetical protein
MKYLALLLFLFASTLSFSKDYKDARGKRITYKINSDTLNTEVPVGMCRISGTIVFNRKLVKNTLVATVDNKVRVRSQKDGSFSMLVSENDTAIYCFKPGHTEVIINNINYKSQHDVNITFFTYIRPIVSARKPVIYLYSDKVKDVELTLNPTGELSFTYPLIKDKWMVTASTNGQLSIGENTYPYLFWESENDNLQYAVQGKNIPNSYQIKTDTVISFFENVLSQIGLTETEQTDFITFWGPELIKKDYALIQFLMAEDYTCQIAELHVKPQPDQARRVFMYFSGSNKIYESVSNVPLATLEFSRKGFTLVEWGGAELQLPAILKPNF